MKTDFETIDVEIRKGVAILKLNNPPVNQLSQTLREEMDEVFKEAFADAQIKAVILTGTGKNFIAGADITEMQGFDDKEDLVAMVLAYDDFHNFIEDGPKPVIAAINGPALGGGLELTMACHYRIASSIVKIGQPEVQLGLIPGAGGTQRLPRLVGLADAIQMITSGVPISANTGLEKGVLDEVVPPGELLEKALEAANKFVAGDMDFKNLITRKRTDKLPPPDKKKEIIALSKEAVKKKAKGLIAPLKAIEAMEKGLGEDFSADIRVEAELFTECAISDVAKNLINIFLNTRSAGRLERIQKVKPAEVKTVAVLGLGVMGAGIANMLLGFGFRALLWDINETALEKGLKMIRKTFSFAVKKGKMTKQDLENLISNNSKTTTNLEDVAEADLVIEAVLEDMAIKKDTWKKIDGICRQDAVFATNTSALPVTELATVLKNPSRMLGLHFFNPAERMPLVEVITAQKTSNETLSTGVAFSRKIGKVPVVVNDGPGFYTSRQLNALMGECNFMLEEGFPLPLIDRCLVEFGMPMGAFTLHDLTGIDIGFHVAVYFEKAIGTRWAVSEIHKKIYETGCYGRKTGSGYYDYSDKKPVPNEKMLEVVAAYLEENNIASKETSTKELTDRMLARAVNEAAYMMEEGICGDRPQDMDLAMVYGCGYPGWRGGIFRGADAWGIDKVYQYLKELEKTYGERFKPADLLKSMASENKTFYGNP